MFSYFVSNNSKKLYFSLMLTVTSKNYWQTMFAVILVKSPKKKSKVGNEQENKGMRDRISRAQKVILVHRIRKLRALGVRN